MWGIFVIMAAVILTETVFIVFFVNKAAKIIDAYEIELEQCRIEEGPKPTVMSKTAKSVKKIWEENNNEEQSIKNRNGMCNVHDACRMR